MDMVFDAAHQERRALELLGNAAQVGMDFLPQWFVAKTGFAILGGKDEVDVNRG
jgi:hypothetical protein